MTIIIDRRKNSSGKQIGNRQRFIRRAKDHIKKAVKEAIQDRSISDQGGEKINLPIRDISEPTFRHARKGGNKKHIITGNKEFIEGDKVPRPEDGGGGGGGGSPDGEGDDDFQFTLTRDEFLNFFFDDLELPDLVKQSLSDVKKWKFNRKGFTKAGTPTNLDIKQTMKMALARRIALKRPKTFQIEELQELISSLDFNNLDDKMLKKLFEEYDFTDEKTLQMFLTEMKRRNKAIPWIDPVDTRYRLFIKTPKPVTQAVMFCLMDVSASMGAREKEISKRFFMLLYMFLQRKYEKVTLVFIRHTHVAKECDEEEFFYSKETGGTIVSAGLELIINIIKGRFDVADWNIYVAQCSDGGNWSNDSDKCVRLILENILPICQYYAYIEIGASTSSLTKHFWTSATYEEELWRWYKSIRDAHPKKFAMKKIHRITEIYRVFAELFKKKDN